MLVATVTCNSLLTAIFLWFSSLSLSLVCRLVSSKPWVRCDSGVNKKTWKRKKPVLAGVVLCLHIMLPLGWRRALLC